MVLILFSVAWLGIVYLINRLIAGRPLKTKKSTAALYAISIAAAGLLGETCLDTLYNALVGHPLWRYQLFPIHYGYTSVYSIYLWGSLGLYIYWLHNTLDRKYKINLVTKYLIFGFDAILFELGVNGSYKLIFHKYLFYYLPADLWHLSSLQALPLYFIAGYIVIDVIAHEKAHPRFALASSVGVVVCIVGAGLLVNK
jgi:hypothetical protein